MIYVERRGIGSEQQVVLWTWLLEGYVPVAHIVAEDDTEEGDDAPSNALADRPGSGRRSAPPQLVRRKAA
jgi:hypothetical protein